VLLGNRKTSKKVLATVNKHRNNAGTAINQVSLDPERLEHLVRGSSARLKKKKKSKVSSRDAIQKELQTKIT